MELAVPKNEPNSVTMKIAGRPKGQSEGSRPKGAGQRVTVCQNPDSVQNRSMGDSHQVILLNPAVDTHVPKSVFSLAKTCAVTVSGK